MGRLILSAAGAALILVGGSTQASAFNPLEAIGNLFGLNGPSTADPGPSQEGLAPYTSFGPLQGPKSDAIRSLKAEMVLISKKDRRLWLIRDGKPFKEYQIALGFNPYGQKMRKGDGRTPEGVYYIDRRNPNSAFHLSLGISYPSPNDRVRAASWGVNPGGDIFIHGLPNERPDMPPSEYRKDWTAGCIGLSNREIEEIWHLVDDGTPVEIRP